ncbi:MAG: hypothetical protein J7M10_03900 [Candidatus Cloacimonetes bacterium]|nr:hypothetical protein [Candidatus Cloacimonadota bacterium]
MKTILTSLLVVLLLLSFSSALYAYDDDTQVLLESIGTLAAQGLYLTYSSIGSTLDAWSFEAYTDSETADMIIEYMGMCEAVSEQLDVLLDSDIMNSEDITYVSEIIDAFDILIDEGDAAMDFIETGEESYLDRFEEKRIAAWDKIAYLLGLE